MGEASDTTFGYADFGQWYDTYRTDVLEPALEHAMDSLQRELEDSLSDRDIARIRSLSGRVKSKRRTWRKVSQPRYRNRIASVDDIPQVIDDLVGMRLTCTNLRDIEMVQGAFENLPRTAAKKRSLGLDPTSERDYVERPKPSGYRGWHVNLDVLLDGAPVTCELQVRTLLQDSWGELTHEDTYSKASESPPLVVVLSTRMADLLATLDDIAEDLRNELDRIDEAIVDETSGQLDEPGDDAIEFGPGADAADLVLERWRNLDRPLELSSLAWALQHEFGAEVSDDWFGFRSFKRFLSAAIPEGEFSSGRQAYLLAPGSSPDTVAGEAADDAGGVDSGADPDDAARPEPAPNEGDGPSDTASAVPAEALELRRVDRGFPLISTSEWAGLFEHLAAAWEHSGGGAPSNKLVNQITRAARDRGAAAGATLSRRHVEHVLKAVLAATDSGEPLSADQVGDVFATSLLQRLADLRIVPTGNAPARARIGRWLLG
ncbi:MAG: GTP pyrophosphokinase family protein [Ilumatobacter sp.]